MKKNQFQVKLNQFYLILMKKILKLEKIFILINQKIKFYNFGKMNMKQQKINMKNKLKKKKKEKKK